MAKLRLEQENARWLVLCMSALILVGTISATLLWPQGSLAFAAPDALDLLPLSGDYKSPQSCRDCHPAEFQAWAETAHARASFDPLFQTFLFQQEQAGECFSCHTTGYDYLTGQFALPGVTCEACHGPLRPDHPEESMTVAASETLCGGCHTNTLAEWRLSRHGQVGVRCADCHQVHSQRLRSSEDTNALCADCHRDLTQDAIHRAHSQASVLCIACHVARPRADARDAIQGNLVTGHTFTVTVDTCDDCHPLALSPLPTQP